MVVGEAEDGAQALTQAAAHRPDVVLMDLRMPRMDGVQATRILRRDQPDTPVVLWSGTDAAQLDRAVCKSGAQVGIPKGIGTVELVATLREAHATRDEVRTVDGPPDSRVDASVEELTAADWAALKQLETSNGYAMRWPVGRQITRSLANRRLVVVASDYVLLTEAGRRALASDSQHSSHCPPGSGPNSRPRLDSIGPSWSTLAEAACGAGQTGTDAEPDRRGLPLPTHPAQLTWDDQMSGAPRAILLAGLRAIDDLEAGRSSIAEAQGQLAVNALALDRSAGDLIQQLRAVAADL
jgi:DNA-binding NarL/FixJ family response regulator